MTFPSANEGDLSRSNGPGTDSAFITEHEYQAGIGRWRSRAAAIVDHQSPAIVASLSPDGRDKRTANVTDRRDTIATHRAFDLHKPAGSVFTRFAHDR